MPINNLPSGVLAQIFSYLNEWMGQKPLRRREPHVLTDVCVQWREIAINERDLWNKLHYDWKVERGQRNGRVSTATGQPPLAFNKMALISSYVERAAGRPLYLAFILHPEEPAAPFAKLFQRHSPFLRNLSLNAPFSVYRALTMTTSTTRRFRKARFPMLEFLHLSMPYENSDKASIRKFTSRKQIDLTGCSQLRQLYVDSPDRSFGFITDNLVSGIPYSQLTQLAITDLALSLMRGREILMQCTSLVRCSLTISQWEEHGAIPLSSAPVILPCLRSLIVGFTGNGLNGQISPFFGALTLPVLEKFTLSAPYAADADIIDELVQLQIRSCAPIRILGLMNVTFPYDEVSNFLRLLPLLQYLRIEAPHDGRCYSYAKILTAIRYHRDANDISENILPDLTEVYIADNLSDWYTQAFACWLAAGSNKSHRLDVSQVLGDHEVLDAIESRCWRHGVTPGLFDPNVIGSPALKSLKVATMLWRNVPIEWLTIKRRVEKRRDDMENIYPIDIHLLLEGHE